MSQAKIGDTVKVHYKGTLLDGTQFESSYEQDPIEFTIGENRVLPKFEEAVIGMNQGEKADVSIPPNDAYGPYRDDLIVSIGRAELPDSIQPKVGMMLQIPSNQGEPFNVLIKEVNDENVLLDGNHPLAGQDLNFEIELVEIVA